MNRFNLSLNIYSIEKYNNILENVVGNCRNSYHDGVHSVEFNKQLLEISDYRCFYCGESLKTNNFKELYFEKEHIINKVSNTIKNKALNKCKYNLIPICKTCNSKKQTIQISDILENFLSNLEKKCPNNKKCNFNDCLKQMIEENFDPFSKNVEFNLLYKVFDGDKKYIRQFDLNKRTASIFLPIFQQLYYIDSQQKGFITFLKEISNNYLDIEFIYFLEEMKLINNYGTRNTYRLNNLIETITLLEEFPY